MEELSSQTIHEMFRNIDEKLDRIEGQTIRTNGRVSKIEVWQGFMKGGLAIITVFILPLLFWALSKV